MLPYILVFTFSTLLFYISTIIANKPLRRMIVVLAILIPCLLAGLRAPQIGTDTQSYLKMYEAACDGSDYSNYLEVNAIGSRQFKNFESGFTLLVYVLRVFNSPIIFLSILELLIIAPMYLGCRKIKSLKKHIWLCMLIFYLLFFNTGLNITRQFIASSLAFYGICSLLSDNKHSLLKCLLFILFAFLIHKSAILVLLIVFAYYIFKQKKTVFFRIGRIRLSPKWLKVTLMLILMVVLLVNAKTVGYYLFDVDGFERYSMYYNDAVLLPMNFILWQIPIIAIVFLSFGDFRKKQDNAPLYIVLLATAIVFGLLGQGTHYGERISYIFKVFYVFILPLLAISIEDKIKRHYVIMGLIMYSATYWLIIFGLNGSHQTIPYLIANNWMGE